MNDADEQILEQRLDTEVMTWHQYRISFIQNTLSKLKKYFEV